MSFLRASSSALRAVARPAASMQRTAIAAPAAAALQQQQRRGQATTAAASAKPKPQGSLSGRTAIVTGSTSGIGLGIARSFLGAGANVMLNGFGEPAAIAALQSQLQQEFPASSIAYSGADMANAEQIHTMVNDTVEKLGSVDILVNNAGIQHVAPISTFPAAQWDRVLSINLTSAFHTIQASLPHLLKSGQGRVINVASVHGLVASANKSAYVAAKHGLIGLTKAVALEQANAGITVNAIAPGWVLTPLVEQQIAARAASSGRTIAEEKVLLVGEKQPMHEFSTPEGLGALAVFLCQPEAKSITGTTMTMDGGWTAQ